MEEGGAGYGADFAVAEKAAQGHFAQRFAEYAGVVVGAPVKVLTAAQAGKQQGAGDPVFAVF